MNQINNFKERTRKDDIQWLAGVIICFAIVVWLSTPPGNKFLQICFWGNNTQMIIAKLKHEDTKLYLFHRNNAVYLAKMYPKGNGKSALNEMDKAIEKLPKYMPDSELELLYKERAQINIFFGNYKQALSDYMRAKDISDINDYLRIAMLYKEAGKYSLALNYCNMIRDIDILAYSGYACAADLYKTAGHPNAAIKIWDFFIDKRPGSYQAYLQRANLKKEIGDIKGYNEDAKKAKDRLGTINNNRYIIDEVLHPKILALSSR